MNPLGAGWFSCVGLCFAFFLNPLPSGAGISLQSQEQTLAAPAPEQQDPILVQAKSLLDGGKAGEARQLVVQYLDSHPSSADGHFLLGYILFREIQEHARSQAAASGASYPDARNKGAGPEFWESNAKASLAQYTEGAKYRTPGAFDLKVVALDYVLLGDYVDADKWLSKALEWSPKDADGWYYLGRTKYNENRFAEAIHAFEECLRLSPQNVKAEDNLGLSYAGLARNADAIAAYRTAIAWQANSIVKDPGPFIDLGGLLLDNNNPHDALTALLQAVAIAPQQSKVHELLGKAYSALDRLAEAQAELEQAVRLAPDNAPLHFMLAQVYRKEGLRDKAKAEFDRAAALNGTKSSPETPRP